MKKQAVCTFLALAGLAFLMSPARGEGAKLTILAAASMRGVMDELAGLYKETHPGVEVTIQSGGSTDLARKALDLELPADVMVLADHSLFQDLLEPAWCDYQVRFATERIVLAYNPEAPGAQEITTKNWAQVLLTNDVRIGMASPSSVPVGYRTLMALRLADLGPGGGGIEQGVMAKVGERNLRPDVARIIAPLETGAFDYAFVYGATAKEAGLHFIELPSEINLGDPARDTDYAKVGVTITGKKPGEKIEKSGGAVLYGASVGKNASNPKDGQDFLALLLSKRGRAVLEKHGFTPVTQDSHLFAGAVPAALRSEAHK